jgi:hypothetical protein
LQSLALGILADSKQNLTDCRLDARMIYAIR